jgi:hypothetical protein
MLGWLKRLFKKKQLWELYGVKLEQTDDGELETEFDLGDFHGTEEEAYEELQCRYVNHLWKSGAFDGGQVVMGGAGIRPIAFKEKN